MTSHLPGLWSTGPSTDAASHSHTPHFSCPPPCRKPAGRLLVLLLAGWLFAGCGAQGPPQPPRVERPEKITDLKATQVGRTLEIRFTVPQRAIDGERLTKPLEIELVRQITHAGETPEESALTPWLSLAADQWPQYVQGGVLVYSAHLSDQEFNPWRGAVLNLAVRTLTRGLRNRAHESELSRLVQVPLADVSGPVENLETHVTEKAIEVLWNTPSRSLSGQAARNPDGYQVYRSLSGKPGSYKLLGESTSPPYLDQDFEFGRTYSYKVRAIFKTSGGAAESEDSEAREVTPRDIFPPAAPSSLTAIFAAGAVELVWTANTEKDLAGYYVYRGEKGGPMQRLKPDLLRTPILRDSTVEPNRTYVYQVTAVDLSNNESPRPEAVEVETQ